MRISPVLFGSLVILVFLGTILGFQSAGVWSVSGKVKDGQSVQPSVEDVETIKGWMTLEQITSAYNVPLADLLSEFNLPANTPATTAIKDLESEQFSVTGLRTWLETRSQASPPPSAPAATPQPTEPSVVEPSTPASTPVATQHVSPGFTVTAKTTFQDLLDWQVPVAAIQAVIGAELPAPSLVIKNYATQKGLEFAPLKAALQAEVDKIR